MSISKLCVGAVSPLVIEEAAKLSVPQIVASRRQVDIGGGYTGLDQEDLVTLVRQHSKVTDVVRDHGGPRQGGTTDNGIASFDADLDAGFDVIHIDVAELPMSDQMHTFKKLIKRYRDKDVDIEIGGEHNTQEWLDTIISWSSDLDLEPACVVIGIGTYVWADRQGGNVVTEDVLASQVNRYHNMGLAAKAHNMDWLAFRSRYVDLLDLYNIAPEYGVVEIDAWLHVMNYADVIDVLNYAYATNLWTRWFDSHEGTYLERARAAVRYLQQDSVILRYKEMYAHFEPYVREKVRDAIATG